MEPCSPCCSYHGSLFLAMHSGFFSSTIVGGFLVRHKGQSPSFVLLLQWLLLHLNGGLFMVCFLFILTLTGFPFPPAATTGTGQAPENNEEISDGVPQYSVGSIGWSAPEPKIINSSGKTSSSYQVITVTITSLGEKWGFRTKCCRIESFFTWADFSPMHWGWYH